MFLTVRSDDGRIRFAVKNGGDEQQLDGERITPYRKEWIHLAVTIGKDEVCLYLNGALMASSKDMTLRPSDFHPLLNYIGRSQSAADPLFNGSIDDFRIYDYALSAEDIKKLADGTTRICGTPKDEPGTFDVGQRSGKSGLPHLRPARQHATYPKRHERSHDFIRCQQTS